MSFRLAMGLSPQSSPKLYFINQLIPKPGNAFNLKTKYCELISESQQPINKYGIEFLIKHSFTYPSPFPPYLSLLISFNCESSESTISTSRGCGIRVLLTINHFKLIACHFSFLNLHKPPLISSSRLWEITSCWSSGSAPIPEAVHFKAPPSSSYSD